MRTYKKPVIKIYMKNLFVMVVLIFSIKFYSQDLEKIKKADTVYVYFKYNKNKQHHNKEITGNTKQEYDYYYYIFSDIPNYQSMTFFHHPLLSPGVRIEKKSFLKQKKELIITFNFLTQFDLGKATQLIENKKVYLIDSKDFRWGKIKLKEVKVEGTVPNVEE